MTGEEHIDSYYAATANARSDYPSITGDFTADVCVIGGGYTGLSTALHLAERGLSVVVLEANRLGWGASGRNGGQICTGFSSGNEPVEAALGRADARKVFDFTEEAKTILRERIARHKIDCDLNWGYVLGAVKDRQLADLRQYQESLAREYGYAQTKVLESHDAIREYVNTQAYIGGLIDRGAGHLHPLNYCLGLGRAAAEAGAQIYEGSRAIAIEEGPKVAVRTAAGAVTADFLVLAGNAYLGDLVPQIHGKVMPVGTYVAATTPLGENRARSLIKDNVAVADCNFVLNYYRLSQDHRMLFGGRVSYSTLMPPNLPHAMRGKMLKVFPELADTTFEYTWGGFVAITMERTPHLGRIGRNVFFAQGFSGQGVAFTAVAGKIRAEAVAGQAERLDLLARLPHTTFPGGRLFRTPTLALAMLWYRMRDFL
jgi:gamma-glutamylputrescine oxidase